MTAKATEIDNDSQRVPYSDEIKRDLDDRYASYAEGKIQLISAEESRGRIKELFDSWNK